MIIKSVFFGVRATVASGEQLFDLAVYAGFNDSVVFVLNDAPG